MLAHRPRRWANIVPTLAESLVFPRYGTMLFVVAPNTFNSHMLWTRFESRRTALHATFCYWFITTPRLYLNPLAASDAYICLILNRKCHSGLWSLNLIYYTRIFFYFKLGQGKPNRWDFSYFRIEIVFTFRMGTGRAFLKVGPAI